MPKNAARKKAVRDRQRATGERYNVARRQVDPACLPFDLSWLHPEVVLCPVCRGNNVEWLLRESSMGPVPEPGEMTEFIRPTDPGVCFDCFAQGQGGSPDSWLVPRAAEPDCCPHCGSAPTGYPVHLPWNDRKHRRRNHIEGRLVPADGCWYRYQCPNEHWWVSAPEFITVEPPL